MTAQPDMLNASIMQGASRPMPVNMPVRKNAVIRSVLVGFPFVLASTWSLDEWCCFFWHS